MEVQQSKLLYVELQQRYFIVFCVTIVMPSTTVLLDVYGQCPLTFINQERLNLQQLCMPYVSVLLPRAYMYMSSSSSCVVVSLYSLETPMFMLTQNVIHDIE